MDLVMLGVQEDNKIPNVFIIIFQTLFGLLTMEMEVMGEVMEQVEEKLMQELIIIS